MITGVNVESVENVPNKYRAMEDFKYKLEKGSKKYRCPGCNKKSFVRYVNNETGEYLPPEYGRCDRENKCSYFVQPDFKKSATLQPKSIHTTRREKKVKKQEPTYIPTSILEATQKRYEQNEFYNNLTCNIPFPFPESDVLAALKLYECGTVTKGYRKGALTIPFIDPQGNTRAIQTKNFDNSNHTRATDWLHTIIEKGMNPVPEWIGQYRENDLLVSCLFGAHLINKYPDNPIALVEAPKTAIIGTLYFGLPTNPDAPLWLAVFNLSSFKPYKLKDLAGRKIAAYPDKGGFNEWNKQATEFDVLNIEVSDLLERENAKKGTDLADYLTYLNWRAFRAATQPTPPPASPQPQPQPQTTNERTAIDPLKILPRKDNFSAKTASEILIRAGIDPNEAEMKITELLKTKKITHLHTGGYYVTESTPF